MECQYKDCKRSIVFDCIQPELWDIFKKCDKNVELSSIVNVDDYILYYCPEHCHKNGFCWHCGFHFGEKLQKQKMGLCDNCITETACPTEKEKI